MLKALSRHRASAVSGFIAANKGTQQDFDLDRLIQLMPKFLQRASEHTPTFRPLAVVTSSQNESY
jgi:hypothetical protein